jgi:hypothetical protein
MPSDESKQYQNIPFRQPCFSHHLKPWAIQGDSPVVITQLEAKEGLHNDDRVNLDIDPCEGILRCQ